MLLFSHHHSYTSSPATSVSISTSSIDAENQQLESSSSSENTSGVTRSFIKALNSTIALSWLSRQREEDDHASVGVRHFCSATDCRLARRSKGTRLGDVSTLLLQFLQSAMSCNVSFALDRSHTSTNITGLVVDALDPHIFASCRFVIWGLFLTLILAAASSALVEHFFPRLSHTMSRKLTWWRGNISEHPLVSQRHSQIVTCGKGCFRWLTFHLPLRIEAMILVAMLAANIAPIVGFYSLYVGNNTYFTGTDAVSRRSQILRHLANRCAMLGISQLPMLILLSSKRTPVAILSQLSMNTMMLFHRWIARTCYCHIIIHTLGNALIFHYSVGFVESMRLLPVQLGTVALITLSGLVFLSLRTLRKKHYEMFIFMHISMAFFMILFTYLHIRFLHQGRVSHKRNQNRLQQKLTPSQVTTRNTATTPDLRH